MTEFPELHRLSDGTIDFDFYRRRAAYERRIVMLWLIAGLPRMAGSVFAIMAALGRQGLQLLLRYRGRYQSVR
jgi:hypothetical protein